MNDSTTTAQSADRYFLCTLPSGEQRVVYVFQGDFYGVLGVVDSAPFDHNKRWRMEDAPEDWETNGEEITEERMRELTGYWMHGGLLLEETFYNLERVRPDDPYYKCIHALRVLAGAALSCDGKPEEV